MERIPVSSPNVKSIGYAPNEQFLEIEFIDGQVHQEFNVSQQRYNDLMRGFKLNTTPPSLGECRYDARFGNFCHRLGIPEQGGLCYWHSRLPKTRERFIEEYQSGGPFEGVIISSLDLRNLNLQGVQLRGFTAYHCSFDNTNLREAFMEMAVFDGCNFIEADLHQVRAAHAKFTNCIFYCANLEGSNLLAADLTNSDFSKANLQGSHIGQPVLIVFPGLGNAHQHRTGIEGANFQGADFRGINLDPVYQDAPNLQEPLYRVWLYEIQSQLDAAKTAQTNKQKKETLEKLTQIIIEKIPGLKVHAVSKRRTTDEIDLIVRNQSSTLVNAGLNGPIFVECKNVAKPVGSEVISKLVSKVPHGGIGLIVTTKTLSQDAEEEISRQLLKGFRLVFWDGSDLEKISLGKDTPEDRLIERYYYVLSL
jgi:uncharacterized protein YjbI with pentapeptide repeats